MANLSSYLPGGIDPAAVTITGGTINGTTIGASTAAAGTFTTFTSNGIDDNADATAITIDSSENVGIGAAPDTTGFGGTFKYLGVNGGSGYGVFNGQTTSTTANDAAVSFFGTTTGSSGYKLLGGMQVINGASSASNAEGTLTFYTATGGSLSERMRISNSGNAIFTKSGGAYLQLKDASAVRGAINVETSDGLVFSTGASFTERMRIDSSGTLNIINSTEGLIQFKNAGTVKGYINVTNTNFDVVAATSSKIRLVPDGAGGKSVTVDTSGRLLIGTSTSVGNDGLLQVKRAGAGAALNLEINNSSVSQNAIDVTNAANAAMTPMRFWVNGYGTTLVGSITTTTSTTSYNTSSDIRLKENITDAPAGNIDAIRVRSFDWKESGVHQTYGMVAQELVDVAPEAVSQGQTEDDIWGVDYSKLVPMMIKEIQDLKAEVAALKGA